MDYKQVTFRITNDQDFAADLLANCLGEIGFDSFEETTQGIIGYCPASLFDEKRMTSAIDELPIVLKYSYRITEIADQNWNEVWEQNSFEPIDIGGRCVIHSTEKPASNKYEYDIIINPKQSFGSGYHQTTRLIIKQLFSFSSLNGKSVLDMGCGTGVLGVLAAKLGAKHVTAIDIDPWSQRNAIENAAANYIKNMEVILAAVENIGSKQFDLILANINRNILLEHLPYYAAALTSNGTLIISGFYATDVAVLRQKAELLGMRFIAQASEEDWTMCVFEK